MSRYNFDLNKPISEKLIPYAYDHGGRDYVAGFERCRKLCLSVIDSGGDLNTIRPRTRLKDDERGYDARIYIDGFNTCLYIAHGLLDPLTLQGEVRVNKH